jgi:hypothetical protein
MNVIQVNFFLINSTKLYPLLPTVNCKKNCCKFVPLYKRLNRRVTRTTTSISIVFFPQVHDHRPF